MSESPAGLDLERLRPWFSEHVAPVAELSAEVIGHGRSNITYRVESDGQEWCVRRPPLSHVQPTAHDMGREFRVISAMAGTDVPAPRTYALCEDPELIGAPFYVMEYVRGVVPIDPAGFAEKYNEATRRRTGEELIDTLAELHALDPADVGLADFGRPRGYVERQVRRFSDQLAKVTIRETPELDEIARRLPKAMPSESDATIVHGDYRLDNAIIDPDGHIAAVLDWEMSTLGDPLADLGMLRMYWRDRDPADGLTGVVGSSGVITLPGFPTFQEGAARYEEKSGRNLGNIDFYIVMAHFKLAVILENMHTRFKAGGTVGAGFEAIGNQAFALARAGLAVADASRVKALRG